MGSREASFAGEKSRFSGLEVFIFWPLCFLFSDDEQTGRFRTFGGINNPALVAFVPLGRPAWHSSLVKWLLNWVRDPTRIYEERPWNSSRRTPVIAAVREKRLEQAAGILVRASEKGEVAAAVLHVVQREKAFTRCFGRARNQDAMFLLGSISKPISVTALKTLKATFYVTAGGV
jgi:hypothetical protein